MIVMLLLFGWAGCYRAQPIAAWRADLQDRLDAHAEGGPAIVAFADQRSPRQPRPGRITFSVLDIPARHGVCDVRGELVDIVEHAGCTWDVFLVGTLLVERGSTRELIDLRPVATCMNEDERQWLTGDADKAQLTAYRDARGDKAIMHGGFPLATDRFFVETSEEVIVITDRDSDARWTLSASAPRH